MKRTNLLTILPVLMAVCVLLSTVAYAANNDTTIYINSASNPISEALDSLYAVGEGNYTEKLHSGTVYAMTADGVVSLGESPVATLAPTTETTSAPTPAVTATPEVPVTPEVTASPETTAQPTSEVTAAPTPEVSQEPVATAEPTAAPTEAPNDAYEDQTVAYSTVKVGIHYGSSAVSEAYLTSESGSGFAFGYFDKNREFHEVARTDVSSITLIPDWNWTTQNGNTFGCYHILPHGSYESFDAAKAEADRLGGFPIYYSGSYFVMIGNYWSISDAEAAMQSMGINGEIISGSCYCIVVTESGTDRILFEYDCGSSSSLAVRAISDAEKPVISYNDLRYYGDFQFARMSGDQFMTAVNYVGIEDYTKGVIPYEMYVSWPQAALEAQALCARNYVVTNFNRYRSQGFDVTADIYSQVYMGIGDATEATNAAVDASAGKYIRYEGALCQTFFFSSDGGATESSENVWGAKVPYLQGVVDPYEDDVETYSKNWSYLCSPEDLQTMVNERESVDLDLIADVDCSYTAMGNMKSITFIDINGKTHTVNGNRCTVVMGAKSQRFQITVTDDGDFEVNGSGWGHNCGMSQYGAYSMAKHHGKTAEEIIKFYYTGVYIR